MRVSIKADSRGLIAALQSIEAFLKSPQPALQQFARYTQQQHVKAFRGRYDPATGKPWKPLAASTIAQRQAGKKRKKTGLASTLFVAIEGSSVNVGYSSPIAAFLHSGAKIPARTVIPKNKQALYWAGASHPVSKIHIPAYEVPARPLVGFSPMDIDRFRSMIGDEVEKLWSL